MASRIIRDKGVFEYIEAIKYLKKKKFNAKFLLIGDIDTENPSRISKSLIKWQLIMYFYKDNNQSLSIIRYKK